MKRSKMILSTALLFIFVMTILSPLSALDYKAGANPASESYKSGKYYDYLCKVKLCGDGAVDVLAVALSQLGYQEGASLSELHGGSAAYGNYTEYNYNMGDFGIGYGGADYHWCASFVSFCLYQSRCHSYGDFFDCARYHENDTDYIWREISCQKWVSALKRAGRFHAEKGYAPKPADLIFFTRDGRTASHIGLVLYSDGNRVYTVEGNTSSATGLEVNGGGVYTKSYKLSNPAILGFGSLPYKSTEENIDHSGSSPSAGYYISSCIKYLYTDASARTRADINLPKYTLFHVSRIASGDGLCSVLECEYNGKTYYIKNNSSRIYQITHEEEKEEITTAPETTKAPETTVVPETTTAPETSKTPNTTDLPETAIAPETTVMPESTAVPDTAPATETTAAPKETTTPDTTPAEPPAITAPDTESIKNPTVTESEYDALSPILLFGAAISAAAVIPYHTKNNKKH